MKYFTFSGLALFFASMGSITTKPMPSTGLKKVNNSPKLAAPEYTSDIISQNFGNTAKYSVLESKLIEDAANAELPPYDPINIEKVEQTRSERAERSKRSLNTPVDGDDLNSLFESPENSNVVHHRSARAIETNAKYATLNNDNCFLTKISHTDYHEHPWDTFLTKCVGEPCDHINYNKEKNIPWSWKSWSAYNLFITEVTPLNDGEVRLGYQYRPSEGLYPSKNSVMHSEKLSCNEPLTPFYSHYKESTNLYQSKQFTEAMTEIELALQEEPNNQFAIDMNNLLRKLVETTTIEPTSSTSNEASSTATSTTPEKITETSLTSLITEASTTKENSSTAMPKDNTTQAESSTPTASQDQTTPSAEDQGWLWNKVVAPIAETAAVVVTTAVIAYALHKLRQCYNKNKTKETLDVELKNCYEPSLLKIVDQIIPINDNGYTDGIKDLLVPLAGTGILDSDSDSCSAAA